MILVAKRLNLKTKLYLADFREESGMDRRTFIKKAGIGAGAAAAGATLAAPAHAQAKKEMVIVSTWPRDFPGLGVSAQRLAKRCVATPAGVRDDGPST